MQGASIRSSHDRFGGKWAWEMTVGLNASDDCDARIGVNLGGVRWTRGAGNAGTAGAPAPAGFVDGCRLTVFIDCTLGYGWVAIDGDLVTGDPAAGTGPTFVFAPLQPVHVYVWMDRDECSYVWAIQETIEMPLPASYQSFF